MTCWVSCLMAFPPSEDRPSSVRTTEYPIVHGRTGVADEGPKRAYGRWAGRNWTGGAGGDGGGVSRRVRRSGLAGQSKPRMLASGCLDAAGPHASDWLRSGLLLPAGPELKPETTVSIVLFAQEVRLPAVSPLSDVMRNAGSNNARQLNHRRKLPGAGSRGMNQVPRPRN